jgi:hypothetical protein
VDTDDLSEKAYEIIVHAARVCDTLKTELGALSYECENEGIMARKGANPSEKDRQRSGRVTWNIGTWRRKKELTRHR